MTFPLIVVGFDGTYANRNKLPPGQQWAGYTTGSPDIRWPLAALDARPGILRICQDSGSDDTADYIDDETGAATDADVAAWYPRAVASYRAAKRPGQRWPGVYKSAGGITPLVNTLIAHGITSGPRLIIANWNLGQPQAAADLAAAIAALAALGLAGDPFPIVGFQFADPGPYDIDVFDGSWVHAVSAKPAPPPPAVVTDGILVSRTMRWTGHRVETKDHGRTWTPVNP